MKSLNAMLEMQFTYFTPALKRPVISCAEDAYQFLINDWADIDEKKSLKVLLLDKEGCLISVARLSRAGIARIVEHPEYLLNSLPAYKPRYMILAHNLAREIDPFVVQLIKEMKVASQLLGLTFLDHLIVTSRKYTSTLSVPYYRIKPAEENMLAGKVAFKNSLERKDGKKGKK